MPITPAAPYPKSTGDPIRSADWNQTVNEVIRLDNAKVNRSGDSISGSLNIDGTVTADNISLQSGATVNEISTDATLAGNSDAAVPTERAVKEYVDNLLAGSVAAFATGTPPSGWLECNGQAISRTTFARLFTRIGTTFGPGNGATTFNVPNLMNHFIRGLGGAGRTLGSLQFNALGSHNHSFFGSAATITGGSHSHIDSTSGTTLLNVNLQSGGTWRVNNQQSGATTSTDSHSHSYTPAGSIGSTGTTETRPDNVALLYCIKF
jgi:microcystin-dependent protein